MVTPSLPQRGRQPKGASPLDPRSFDNFFFKAFQYTAMLHGARVDETPSARGSIVINEKRSFKISSEQDFF